MILMILINHLPNQPRAYLLQCWLVNTMVQKICFMI